MKQIETVLYTVLCMLTGVVTLLSAQEAQKFSLDDARRYAVNNNRDVKKALLGIDAADKQVWEVTANGFPQIEISGTYQHLIDIPTQQIPGEFFGAPAGTFIPVKFGTPHNARYGISASQLIFSGSYFVGVQASRIYRQLSEQNYARTRLEVKATVTNTYNLILIAEENRRILIKSKENLERTLYEIDEMHKEGFVEQTDVKQLRISLNELESGIRALDQQIEVAYKLLKLQMGIDIDKPITLSDNLDSVLRKTDLYDPMERPFNVRNTIGLKAMITQEELAGLSYKNEKVTFLPTLAAFASVQRDAQRTKFNIFDRDEKWYPTTIVGVQLSWPIFSGSAKIFRMQKAKIELDQARLQREQAEQGLQLEYQRARSALSSALDRFKNSEANRELSKEVYETTLEKYREGLVSSLELTQGHNQYLSSERTYLQAVSDLLNARTALAKLLETI